MADIDYNQKPDPASLSDREIDNCVVNNVAVAVIRGGEVIALVMPNERGAIDIDGNAVDRPKP